MHAILRLLEEKNYFLSQYLSITKYWLADISKGNFDKSDIHVSERDEVLKKIQVVDQDISEKENDILKLDAADIEKHREQVLKLFSERDSLVGQILACDRDIFKITELEKEKVAEELASHQFAKKAIGAYKSSNI